MFHRTDHKIRAHVSWPPTGRRMLTEIGPRQRRLYDLFGLVTATTALPMAWGPLEAALRQRRPVGLSYHGEQRLVCPHALGCKNDRPMVLAYQVGGWTTSGRLPADPRKRWRCLFVAEIDQVGAAGPAGAWGPADNYNPLHLPRHRRGRRRHHFRRPPRAS